MDTSFQAVSPITLPAPHHSIILSPQYYGCGLHRGNNLCGSCVFYTSVFLCPLSVY